MILIDSVACLEYITGNFSFLRKPMSNSFLVYAVLKMHHACVRNTIEAYMHCTRFSVLFYNMYINRTSF